jgi:hypothetical protein
MWVRSGGGEEVVIGSRSVPLASPIYSQSMTTNTGKSSSVQKGFQRPACPDSKPLASTSTTANNESRSRGRFLTSISYRFLVSHLLPNFSSCHKQPQLSLQQDRPISTHQHTSSTNNSSRFPPSHFPPTPTIQREGVQLTRRNSMSPNGSADIVRLNWSSASARSRSF